MKKDFFYSYLLSKSFSDTQEDLKLKIEIETFIEFFAKQTVWFHLQIENSRAGAKYN